MALAEGGLKPFTLIRVLAARYGAHYMVLRQDYSAASCAFLGNADESLHLMTKPDMYIHAPVKHTATPEKKNKAPETP